MSKGFFLLILEVIFAYVIIILIYARLFVLPAVNDTESDLQW